jgi:hypothetical protein
VLEVGDGKLLTVQAPYLNALNERLRDDYVADAKGGIERWNKIIQKAGIPFVLGAPHKAFNRKIGPLSAAKISPDGKVLSEADWTHHHLHWLPSVEDRAFVASLMGRVAEPESTPTGSRRRRAGSTTRRWTSSTCGSIKRHPRQPSARCPLRAEGWYLLSAEATNQAKDTS